MARFTRRTETPHATVPDDAGGAIAPLLLRGERILGWTNASPLAQTSTRSPGRRLAAVGAAIGLGAARASDPHVAGEPESAAWSLLFALDGPVTVAITDQRVTFWSFHRAGPGRPPIALAAVPRAELRWIAKTGRVNEVGSTVRLSFADESFIDLAVTERASFWAAAADIGR